MKSFISLLAILACVPFVGFAQNTENRNVSGFSSVQVRSGIDLYLSQGGNESLKLEYKGLDTDEVKTEVKNGVLQIYIDRKGFSGWSWGRSNYVKVYLSFNQLNAISANGGSDVFSNGTLTFKELNLNVGGGSDAKLDLKADVINVSSNGGSDAKLTGSARVLNAESSGGSDLKAEDFEVEICKVRASGGSDAYVRANKEVYLDASGGSDVYWYGRAKIISKRSSGGSDIHH
jgi:hypothetical protein